MTFQNADDVNFANDVAGLSVMMNNPNARQRFAQGNSNSNSNNNNNNRPSSSSSSYHHRCSHLIESTCRTTRFATQKGKTQSHHDVVVVVVVWKTTLSTKTNAMRVDANCAAKVDDNEKMQKRGCESSSSSSSSRRLVQDDDDEDDETECRFSERFFFLFRAGTK